MGGAESNRPQGTERNKRSVFLRDDSLAAVSANIAGNIVGKHYDCSSEPFTKPTLCSTLINRMKTFTLGSKKQSFSKYIISNTAAHLDRVTAKVFGESQAYNVVDDLSLEECEVFITRWSKELNNLRSNHRSHFGKFPNVERFQRSLEGLKNRKDQVQKLTEAQKDFLWFIQILKSLPKSSVCQEECARTELLNLYRRWKKGQLISVLPIMNFIMETLLNKKDTILKLASK